jgi:hypothetical protein
MAGVKNLSSGELEERLKELYRNTELYGYSAQTDAELKALRRAETQTIMPLLVQTIKSDSAGKHATILALILAHTHERNMDFTTEAIVDKLKNKLYQNDFKFLLTHIFPKRIPLPPDLVYDLTERVIFNIEDSYGKAATGFRRVPKKNAKEVVNFLALQLCRAEFNSQNRDLLHIVLSHLKVPIPPNLFIYVSENLERIKEELKLTDVEFEDLTLSDRPELENWEMSTQEDTEAERSRSLREMQRENITYQSEQLRRQKQEARKSEKSLYDLGQRMNDQGSRTEDSELSFRKQQEKSTKEKKESIDLNRSSERSGEEERPSIFNTKQNQLEDDQEREIHFKMRGSEAGQSNTQKEDKKARYDYKSLDLNFTKEIDKKLADQDDHQEWEEAKNGEGIELEGSNAVFSFLHEKPELAEKSSSKHRSKSAENNLKKLDMTGFMRKHKKWIVLAMSILAVIIIILSLMLLLPLDSTSSRENNTPIPLVPAPVEEARGSDSVAIEQEPDSPLPPVEENIEDKEVIPLEPYPGFLDEPARGYASYDIVSNAEGFIWTVGEGDSFWELYRTIYQSPDLVPEGLSPYASQQWEVFFGNIQRSNPLRESYHEIYPGEVFEIPRL